MICTAYMYYPGYEIRKYYLLFQFFTAHTRADKTLRADAKNCPPATGGGGGGQ